MDWGLFLTLLAQFVIGGVVASFVTSFFLYMIGINRPRTGSKKIQ